MGSLAAETRSAVDESPFLRDALRAGVVNYAAAARYLDVSGDVEAIATALRRYAEELPPLDRPAGDVRVRMERGVDRELLSLQETHPDFEDGEATAIIAVGDVGPRYLGSALLTLATQDIPVYGAGLVANSVLVVVPGRHGAAALRSLERDGG